MSKFEVNKDKCIKCNACINDCITYSIESENNGFPYMSDCGEDRCINCQHCFMVCPTVKPDTIAKELGSCSATWERVW